MSLRLSRTVPAHTIVAAAASLRSDDGENPEYDRALTELVRDLLMDGEHDSDQERETTARLLGIVARDSEMCGHGNVVTEHGMSGYCTLD